MLGKINEKDLKIYNQFKKEIEGSLTPCELLIDISVYNELIKDYEDLKSMYSFLRKIENMECRQNEAIEFMVNICKKYENEKNRLYNKIKKLCKEAYTVTGGEWHHLAGLSQPVSFSYKCKYGEKYSPKVYIKMCPKRFIDLKENMEKYFDFLYKIIEYGISKSFIHEIKMPTTFSTYVSRKDGCIFYLNATSDGNKYTKFIKYVADTAREFGIADDIRITFGFDTENRSYSEMLVEEIFQIMRNGNKTANNNYKSNNPSSNTQIKMTPKEIIDRYGSNALNNLAKYMPWFEDFVNGLNPFKKYGEWQKIKTSRNHT